MSARRAIGWGMFALAAAACAAPRTGVPWAQDPGKLGKATKAVTGASEPVSGGSGGSGGGPTTSPRRGTTRGADRYDDDDDDGDDLMGSLLEPVGEILLYAAALPITGPHHWLERDPGSLRNGYYAAYPYAAAEGGLVADGYLPRADRHAVALRVAGEYGNDFAGIERYGACLRLDTAVRFGLDTTWSHFREELPGGGTDTLDLGDVNLVYRFAQGEKGEMRAGLGMNWFHDGPIDEYGFNATYAGDFHPARPWVVSFELDYGKVGSAERFHGRLTAGAQWRRAEVFVGFDFESLDSVGLPTWTAGLRWWF